MLRGTLKTTKFGVLALTIVALIMSIHGVALGNIQIENAMAADFAANISEGNRIYEYGTGSQHVFTSDADFESGTYSDNLTIIDDTAIVNEDWWDENWTHRQCFTVALSQTLGQYPFRIEVDTTGFSADDIRVVEATLPANTATPVPHYTEGVMGAADTVVWFQGQGTSAGKEYCVYFGSGQASTSDQFAPFTYTNGQVIRYYTMLPDYGGNATDSQITVVSYVGANTVSDGTTTVVLNAGQFHTFNGINPNSVITATGPIDGSNNTDQKEALLPEAFADHTLVMPTNRGTQRFYVRSPHGSTTIEAVQNGAVVWSGPITPADGVITVPVDATSYITLRSTNGVKFLASHISTENYDSFHGVPWFGDDLYGVASENFHIGSPSATTANHFRHTGVSGAINIPTNSLFAITGNGSGRGNGVAYRVEPTGGRVAAIQQRDDNGVESTMFLPERLLSQTYRIPIPYRYFTISCPTIGTQISVNGGAAQSCNGTGVGHLYSGLGSFPAGTLIEADHPIFVYYEDQGASDETNIYGAKASIPFSDSKYLADSVEKFDECGTWTSPVFATQDTFGQAFIDTTLSAGGTYTYRISFDGGAFNGPDGTPATSYTSGDIIPYSADGATTAQIQVDLCGSGSLLTSVSFECDLQERFHQDVIDVFGNGPILRVYPTQVNSRVRYDSSVSADTYDVNVDVSSTHIQSVSGTVTNPAPVFSSQPYSVVFANVSTQQSTLQATLVDTDSVAIETSFTFNIDS